MLEAAVDLAQRTRGLNHNGPGRAFGFHIDYSACGYHQPVDDPAAGFIQQHATAG